MLGQVRALGMHSLLAACPLTNTCTHRQVCACTQGYTHNYTHRGQSILDSIALYGTVFAAAQPTLKHARHSSH